ncbi:hypothetical protein DSO57_1035984 [Entomophthora muscae]|uniref:Uncharacterized protein n=1 Tax=Entomophthora muscae TaxID=34485 RepID=A0ACC2TLB8_9FUNG|nr:hypothetical protein DSO57_1035984 [Entomophthora muscae]
MWQAQILSSLTCSEHNWSYAAAKNALLYKFGSISWVTERKNEFLIISFKKDKTIADFADWFYLEAQILMGSGLLTVHDVHIALHAAVKPYEVLYHTLMPAFQDNCTLDGMVWYLRQCGNTFGLPNVRTKPCPAANFLGYLEVAPALTSLCPRLISPRWYVIAAIGRATTLPTVTQRLASICCLP